MKAIALLLLPIAALLNSGTNAADLTTSSCKGAPETMRAARIHAKGGPDSLRIESIAVPVPGPGEVLVRVHFASVNPVDWKLQRAGRMKFPATPGADFSGEVVALGAGVSEFACGDLVAGAVDQSSRGGSYAQYLTAPAADVVRKPSTFSMADAAAYPTATIAAYRYMVKAAGLKKGEKVLIHGGAGGVGSVAIQIAEAMGAHVVTTASARNHQYLKELGADQVIDYRTTQFDEVVRDVDVVIDTIGGDTLRRSERVLRDGGRLVSMTAIIPPDICSSGRVLCPREPEWNVGESLEAVRPLIESGKIKINIDRTYTLDQVVGAQQYNMAGGTRGKVVIQMY